MTEKMIIITDLNTLRRWRAEIGHGFAPAILPRAQFSLAALAEASNVRFTVEAERLHRACGCTTSGLAMTVAVLLSGLAIAVDPRGPTGLPLLSWGGYFLFILAAAAAGKFGGLFWARRQMLHLAGSVEALIGAGGQDPTD